MAPLEQLHGAMTAVADGTNKKFYIVGSACTRQITELVIVNRWGEVIFRNQNVPPSDPASGWNGRYQGVMAGSGTYAYTLLVDYVTGVTNRLTGKILLTR